MSPESCLYLRNIGFGGNVSEHILYYCFENAIGKCQKTDTITLWLQNDQMIKCRRESRACKLVYNVIYYYLSVGNNNNNNNTLIM